MCTGKCDFALSRKCKTLNLSRYVNFILYPLVKAIARFKFRATTNSSARIYHVRIVTNCYIKCRDVNVNKLQELHPSGGGMFPKVQGTSSVYIYYRRKSTSIRREEGERARGKEEK